MNFELYPLCWFFQSGNGFYNHLMGSRSVNQKHSREIRNITDINGQKLSIKKNEYGQSQNEVAFYSEDKEGNFSQYLNTFIPEKNIHKNLSDNINKLKAKEDNRHSIIPIKKIMFFYTSRLVNGLSKAEDDKKEQIIKAVFQDLSQIIDANMTEFLIAAPLEEDIHISDINTFIDCHRKKYACLAEGLVASKLAVENHPLFEKEEVKKYFKECTAVTMDMIDTNLVTGIKTHTAGIEASSHSKKSKPPAIVCIKKYTNFSQEEQLVQTQYRTPSLVKAVLEGGGTLFSGANHDAGELSIKEQVEDFAKTISSSEQYDASRPIIYNLLTSLSSSNHQDKAAQHNFHAMHDYNQGKEKSKPYYYIMNVPVNQWGNTLCYHDNASSLQKEAAFFTDLSMLDAVPDQNYLPQDLISEIEKIKKVYRKYLDTENRPAYFCESTQWRSAKDAIESVKIKMEKNLSAASDVSNFSTEKKLWRVYAKLHLTAFHGDREHQKELGSLIQAMFLALHDNNNLKGCKSAVDRFSFVEGLNNLFLAYLKGPSEPLSSLNEETNLATNLEIIDQYIKNDSKMTALDFASKIHTIHNKFNVYDASMDCALNDANDSKHIANHGGKSLKANHFNTNIFVPAEYSNVQQANAPSLQAEKNGCKRAMSLLKGAKKINAYASNLNSAGSRDYRELCVKVLKKYANSWSLLKNHKKKVRATLEQLRDPNIDVMQAVKDLKNQIQRDKNFNSNGKLQIKLDFLFFGNYSRPSGQYFIC